MSAPGRPQREVLSAQHEKVHNQLDGCHSSMSVSSESVVAALIERARAAQRVYETWSQQRVDEAQSRQGT